MGNCLDPRGNAELPEVKKIEQRAKAPVVN